MLKNMWSPIIVVLVVNSLSVIIGAEDVNSLETTNNYYSDYNYNDYSGDYSDGSGWNNPDSGNNNNN